MTGRVFTKLFFSFVVVLFLGMVVLDFSLRQVMEQSLRAQAEESLVGEARMLAAHLSASSPAFLNGQSFDAQSLQRIARLDATAAGAEVSIFDAQGQMVTSSEENAATEAAVAPEVAAVVDQHQSLGRARRGQTLYVAVPAGPLAGNRP